MPIRWPSVSRPCTNGESPRRAKRAVSDPPTEGGTSAQPPEALPGQSSLKHLGLEGPGLSRIVTDAALYDQVVSDQPSDPSTRSMRGTGELTLYESLCGFSRLLGKDLNSTEKQASVRLAQLSVNNWASREPTDIEEEPDDGSPEASSDETTDHRETPSTLTLLEERAEAWEEFEAAEEELEAAEDSAKLRPEQIIHLLEREFGALADSGEEKLILEADCALVQDVLVLGVVHLTTHRISFHASLPPITPSESKVIKAGPVYVHHKGWRRKRRIWMELSHDIICTYPSSKDEHRIKPIKSILLSSIKGIEKLDQDHPKSVRVSYEGIGNPRDDVLEFDTEESAREWRREFHGAVFLYRQGRRRALSPDNTDDSNGVRFNVPLSRLGGATYSKFMSFAFLIELKVLVGPRIPVTSSSTTRDAHERKLSQDSQASSDAGEASGSSQDAQLLRITVLKEEPEWRKLMNFADSASDYEKTHKVAVPQALFDFDVDGGGYFDEPKEPGKLKEIVNALGIHSNPWTVRACISRRFSMLYGTFVLADDVVGFLSRTITLSPVIYRIPLSNIVGVIPSSTQHWVDHALVLQIRGQPDLRFSFRSEILRDEAITRIRVAIDMYKESALTWRDTSPPKHQPEASVDKSVSNTPSGMVPPHSPPTRSHSLVPIPSSPSSTFQQRLKPSRSTTSILAPLSRIPRATSVGLPYELKLHMPKAINLPHQFIPNVRKMHIVCLTIGSRGDVQPYIALARGLQAHGHSVTIVTHDEYKSWVKSFGVGHRTAGGDPGALMKLSVENKMFSPQFFKEGLTNFRSWLDQLLVDAWEQCKDADLLLESPSAMAGVHIAEALKIPYFRTFTMPWTKTREFPHAFLSPPVESPTFNSASYVLFDNVFWAATSGQINRWRKNTLKIGPTDMGHMAQAKIPFIYNFSSAVVPKPLDYGDTTILSGYWFLDNPDPDWEAPQSLLDFMNAARKDGRPLVYIGFGSITVPDPNRLTTDIIYSVLKADVRAIVSRGWSARMAKQGSQEIEYPDQCYVLDKVPHDWLFPQMDAVVHHGGAGTTGASLRAGVPTLIRPWFGDQFFWASRVQKLGAGLRVHNLRGELADAFTRATSDRVMKEKAASVGERIRLEDGVGKAIEAIYTYLPRAARQNRAELD